MINNNLHVKYLTNLIGISFLCCLVACSSDEQSAATGEVNQDSSRKITAETAGKIPPCDRQCLEGFIDQYLAALAANDPSGLPLADDVIFVENNQRLEIGDGTWRTATGLGKYRHYFADPQTGQAAAMTVIEENGKKILFDLRLAINDRQIREIEALVIHGAGSAGLIEELGKPLPEFLETIPVEQRVSREELVATANKYLTGMENNNPDGDYSFFADDCDRLEHGRKTTNNDPEAYGHSTDDVFVTLTCREQFETGFLGFVTRIRDRRYVVVDEERQTVFGLVVLDHNGTVREIDMSNDRTFVLPPYFSTPRTLFVGEAWRIRNDKLFKIEMTLTEVPYGNRPQFNRDDGSWLTYAGNDNTLTGDGSSCDQDCLEKAANDFLTAMLTHEPDELPMPASIKYTENGQRLRPGDGLWGTLTELGDFRMILTDQENGTAGIYTNSVETDVPGVFMARLKVSGNQISEIEVVVVREEFVDERGGTLTLFGPRMDTGYKPDTFIQTIPDSMDQKVQHSVTAMDISTIVNQYTDGFASHDGGQVPFAGECRYRINGHPVTGNEDAPAVDPEFPEYRPYSMSCAEQLDSGTFGFISGYRDRKELVVDVEKGLLMDLLIFDVPDPAAPVQVAGVGDVMLPEVAIGPYSMLVARMFRLENGEITNIEAVSLPVPYGMESGW